MSQHTNWTTTKHTSLVWHRDSHACVFVVSVMSYYLYTHSFVYTSNQTLSLWERWWYIGFNGNSGVETKETRFNKKRICNSIHLAHKQDMPYKFAKYRTITFSLLIRSLFPWFLHHYCPKILYISNFLIENFFVQCCYITQQPIYSIETIWSRRALFQLILELCNIFIPSYEMAIKKKKTEEYSRTGTRTSSTLLFSKTAWFCDTKQRCRTAHFL